MKECEYVAGEKIIRPLNSPDNFPSMDVNLTRFTGMIKQKGTRAYGIWPIYHGQGLFLSMTQHNVPGYSR